MKKRIIIGKNIPNDVCDLKDTTIITNDGNILFDNIVSELNPFGFLNKDWEWKSNFIKNRNPLSSGIVTIPNQKNELFKDCYKPIWIGKSELPKFQFIVGTIQTNKFFWHGQWITDPDAYLGGNSIEIDGFSANRTFEKAVAITNEHETIIAVFKNTMEVTP